MKKAFIYLLAGALLLNICSCSFQASLDDGEVSFTVAGGIPAAVSKGDETVAAGIGTVPEEKTVTEGKTASEEKTDATDEEQSADEPSPEEESDVADAPAEASGYLPAGEYIRIEQLETRFGSVFYPVFDTEKLDKGDAQAANAFFEDIRDAIAENIEQYLEIGEDVGDDAPVYDLCTTEYALNAGILSVMVRYEYYFGYPIVRFKTANFDLSTGKVMSAGEVIEKACFTSDEAENALLKYTEMFLKREAQYAGIINCCLDGTLPAEGEDFYEDWSDLYELVRNAYSSKTEAYPDIEKEGRPWEELPLFPGLFFSEYGELFVVGTIPAGSASDIYSIPVQIGHDDVQTAVLNYRNPYAPVSDRPYLTPKGAEIAVSGMINSDYPVSYSVEGIEFLTDPNDEYGGSMPAYIIRAAAMNGNHAAEEWLFGVSMFEHTMWAMDDEYGWIALPMGTSALPDPSWEYENGALGRMITEPDEYETWAADPAATADLTGGSECFLAGALYDGTLVSILECTLNSDGSLSTGRVLFQTELNYGEWIKVCAGPVPENLPSFAVEFATGFDKGTLYYASNGGYDGEPEEVIYAFSDDSVG